MDAVVKWLNSPRVVVIEGTHQQGKMDRAVLRFMQRCHENGGDAVVSLSAAEDLDILRGLASENTAYFACQFDSGPSIKIGHSRVWCETWLQSALGIMPPGQTRGFVRAKVHTLLAWPGERLTRTAYDAMSAYVLVEGEFMVCTFTDNRDTSWLQSLNPERIVLHHPDQATHRNVLRLAGHRPEDSYH